MDRRDILRGIACLAACPTIVLGQRSPRSRIGILNIVSSRGDRLTAAFRQRLIELGYVEGQDVLLDVRWAEGRTNTLSALANELLSLKPDILVAGNTSTTLTLRRLTTTTPIVAALLTDPIGFGLADSLARPGRNVTGTLLTLDSLSGKHLQIARDITPNVKAIGVLTSEDAPTQVRLRHIQEAAAALGVAVIPSVIRNPSDLELAFNNMRGRVDFAFVPPGTLFTNERQKIAKLAIEARVPTISWYREHAEDGGLVSYGSDLRENYKRTADYVDKIIRGAKPADLPIEFPTKFELVVNLKTARGLGLTIPEAFLLRADEVIE